MKNNDFWSCPGYLKFSDTPKQWWKTMIFSHVRGIWNFQILQNNDEQQWVLVMSGVSEIFRYSKTEPTGIYILCFAILFFFIRTYISLNKAKWNISDSLNKTKWSTSSLFNKAHVIGHRVAINDEKQWFLVMSGVSEIFRYSKTMMKNNDF